MIDFPVLFKEILERDGSLYSMVLRTYAEFGQWIESSRTPFFPNYTDHGLKHIRAVLHACESLIPERSTPLVSSVDVAVLSIAVLLHDSALHITEDAFVALMQSKRRNSLDQHSWTELWQKYRIEIKHLDQRQLLRLLGNPEPVEAPAMDPKRWRIDDYLIIGEFIRRHHARIAHELALWGLRDTRQELVQIHGWDEDLKDLAGLVARSHGYPIRSMFPHLQRVYHGPREYRAVHPVYLMCLLRIADVLRVEADRAPEALAQIRNIRIPSSIDEWKAHWAIRDLRYTHDDPEAVFVDVRPEDVPTFLRTKQWVWTIQDELDRSWATLGEVYGSNKYLSNLGLSVRRVRSNIDDLEQFSESVEYVPELIRFETAGADLLKLLIQPLYGSSLSAGVRELLQNAVDAVREREVLDGSYSQTVGPDVSVRIDRKSLTIEDRGIGMDLSVICDYFLKAGASLRTNQKWVQDFVDPESGVPHFSRTGRFGIGVLAGFLLGPELDVTTRHFRSNTGYHFRARIDQESIEVRKIERDVGTTIRIVMHPKSTRMLARGIRTNGDPAPWLWYRLRRPTVSFSFGNDQRVVKTYAPGPGDDLGSTKWHRISHPMFSDIQWRYFDFRRHFLCNGFVIPRKPVSWGREHGAVPLKVPSVSVYDPNGVLPLSLDRRELVDDLPFSDELMRDVTYGLIASLLAAQPNYPFTDPRSANWYRGTRPGVRTFLADNLNEGMNVDGLFTTTTGVGLVDAWSIHACEIKSVLGIVELHNADAWHWYNLGSDTSGYHKLNCHIPLRAGIAALRARVDMQTYDPTYSVRELLDFILGDDEGRLKLGNGLFSIKGIRLLLPSLVTGSSQRWDATELHMLAIGFECLHADPAWSLWELGKCSGSRSLFYKLLEQEDFSEQGWAGYVVQYFIETVEPSSLSPAAEVWAECVGGPLIPFSAAKRLQILHAAPERLSYFLSKRP